MKKLATVCSLFMLIFLYSCKKDPVTKPVHFDSTTYEDLGHYSQSGKPDYLTTPDVVSQDLLSYYFETLPEGQDLRKTNPGLLTTDAIADVKIQKLSDVFITFVYKSGAYSNSFAFYTYPTGKPPLSTKDIKEIKYVFPNAGYLTPLRQGDKVKIGRFEPGTSIGFVLLQNAWDTLKHTINSKAVHLCSNDVLNPEVDPNLKKHAVLIDYPKENKVLVGFEDMDRTFPRCDHDFNDLLVYCTVTPVN